MDRSPFSRAGHRYESSGHDCDISFVCNGRPNADRMFHSMYDDLDSGTGARLSYGSDYDARSYGSSYSGPKSIDMNSPHDQDNFSFTSSQSSGIGSLRLSDQTVISTYYTSRNNLRYINMSTNFR